MALVEHLCYTAWARLHLLIHLLSTSARVRSVLSTTLRINHCCNTTLWSQSHPCFVRFITFLVGSLFWASVDALQLARVLSQIS